jgi:hypothetical protein
MDTIEQTCAAPVVLETHETPCLKWTIEKSIMVYLIIKRTRLVSVFIDKAFENCADTDIDVEH